MKGCGVPTFHPRQCAVEALEKGAEWACELLLWDDADHLPAIYYRKPLRALLAICLRSHRNCCVGKVLECGVRFQSPVCRIPNFCWLLPCISLELDCEFVERLARDAAICVDATVVLNSLIILLHCSHLRILP